MEDTFCIKISYNLEEIDDDGLRDLLERLLDTQYLFNNAIYSYKINKVIR